MRDDAPDVIVILDNARLEEIERLRADNAKLREALEDGSPATSEADFATLLRSLATSLVETRLIAYRAWAKWLNKKADQIDTALEATK